MKKLHLSRGTISKIFASLCVLLLFVYLVPHRAFASDFTVSNVTFDPTSGVLSFDYTGTSISDIDGIRDSATATTTYWNRQAGSCTSSHCWNEVAPYSSDSGVTSVVIVSSAGLKSQTLNYPFPLPTTNTPQTPIVGGWTNVGETWTYASADSPTFTATVSGDLTGVYAPGMRVKLTQSSTTKYFIITAASYSSPNTTITLYGGTDYTLANATISNVYFSMQKAPLGFPLDPAKWTVQTIYSSSGDQNNPTSGTWYNIGSVSLTVPIGAWRLFYSTVYGFDSSASQNSWAWVTLSTSNNSEDDANMSCEIDSANSLEAIGNGYKEKFINLTGKTTYYMDLKAGTSGMSDLYNGGAGSPTVIRAVSTYL